MAAGERYPHHALGIDVATARTEAQQRYVVDLRQLGLWIEPQHASPAREDMHGVPNRTVRWIRNHRIRAAHYPHILVRIDRLARLAIVVELAVPVGVEHERRPALRLLGITGLVEDRGIEPSRHRA